MSVWTLIFWAALALGVVCVVVGLVLTLRRKALEASE